MNIVKILNTIGFLLLVYIWIFAVISFFSLPEMIPVHFDFDGKADSHGNRLWILTIPLVATVVFYLMKYTAKQKNLYSRKIPTEMKRNRGLTNLFVKMILVYVMMLFADIATEAVLIAQGKYEALSGFSHVLIGLMMVSIVGFFIYARRKIHIID
ncbi:MAG: DUF1648 domain-containing protein [Bergeyella sp.]